VGYHVYLRHGTAVCWQIKIRIESGPVTADLTTTVVHSYTLLINDVKPSLTLSNPTNQPTNQTAINTIYKQFYFVERLE